MFTYQDFEYEVTHANISTAIRKAIQSHKASKEYKIALDADNYDRQQNTTIMSFIKILYSADGYAYNDELSANNKLCSNFFNHFNTQRTNYSLGNGITFNVVGLKEKLGKNFDTKFKDACYKALIHRISFVFWNVNHVHVFEFTEFCPLWDEETGALRAGIRFWQIDSSKPIMAVLYEEDGYSTYKADRKGAKFDIKEGKRAYRINYRKAPADIEPEIVGEENYTALPIIPMWGSKLHQSTLVGMKGKIDGYDLIASGLINDFQDLQEVYWIVNNAGGMDDDDLLRFRDRLKYQKIANVADADHTGITPYTQEIPTAGRETALTRLRNDLYEDYGALDVHTIAAGATNDHIDAAYQPLDDNADDFEYQIIECIQALLRVAGFEDDIPTFKRNRISNQKEQTEMVLSAADYLDDETILKKLPFITPDEIEEILKKMELKRAEEDTMRMHMLENQQNPQNQQNQQPNGGNNEE